MKNLIRNIFIGCTFFFVSSCSDDFLDLQPEVALSTDLFLASVDDFESAIVGGYSQLSLADWYGRYMLLIPDIMGNDIKPNASANRGAAWALYTGGPTTDQNENREFWQEIYQAINLANSMINADYTPPAAAQARFNQVLGEAYAIRALGHFDLVRLFAQTYTSSAGGGHPGVPIVTEFDIESQPTKNTVGEVYTQVIADFQQAITLMTVTPATATTLSREAAQGLLARVYLYMGDWANAEAMATNVVNSGQFSLTAAADYPTMFLDGNSSEAMFEISMTLADNRGSDHIGGMYKETGYGDYLPAQDLLGLFAAGDVRGTLFAFDTNLDGGIYASGDGLGRRVNKWPSAGTTIATDNVSVIRYSEVLLIRAEARARQSNDAGAITDLDAVRLRSDATATATTLSGQALIDEILVERRRELFAEGHRIFDITRTASNLVRNDCTSPGVCTITFPNDRFILALPEAELTANPNIAQNAGYGGVN